MKHTAGEWKAKGGKIVSLLNPHYDTTIAQIPVGLSQSERIANAQLIAAAPDLLQALKSIAGLEAWIQDKEMKIHFQKTVYAAIKKAEP